MPERSLKYLCCKYLFFFFFLGFSYEGINSLKGFNVMVAVETNSNPTKKKKEKNLIEF